NDRRWVLDAKYKRGYGEEERRDRFQMTAYAMAFDARRATLVYPTAVTTRPRWRLLLAGQIGSQPTTIDSIELPMSAGPAACRRDALARAAAVGARGGLRLPTLKAPEQPGPALGLPAAVGRAARGAVEGGPRLRARLSLLPAAAARPAGRDPQRPRHRRRRR